MRHLTLIITEYLLHNLYAWSSATRFFNDDQSSRWINFVLSFHFSIWNRPFFDHGDFEQFSSDIFFFLSKSTCYWTSMEVDISVFFFSHRKFIHLLWIIFNVFFLIFSQIIEWSSYFHNSLRSWLDEFLVEKNILASHLSIKIHCTCSTKTKK